jgi:chemotaxis signal transduction protein
VDGIQIRVRVGAEQYALPVEYVHEVVDLSELTPVPGAADSVLGLHNLNGEIVPAFDLARILRIERDGHRSELDRSKIAQRRLLVTECDGQRAALAVDEVIEVGPLAGTLQESESQYLLASTVIDGTMVGVLAVDALFDALASGDGR